MSDELANGKPSGIAGAIRVSALEKFGNFFLAPRIGGLAALNARPSVELITIQQIMALPRREADIAVILTAPTTGRFVLSTKRTTAYSFIAWILPGQT